MKDYQWLLGKPIAHRGLHDDVKPENSIAAFAAAADAGFNIEIDVHLTADGKVVVHHDGNLKRVAGVDLVIEKSNYEEIIKHGLKGTDQVTPLLSSLLELVAGRVGLLIEFKNNNPLSYALERETLKILKDYDGPICLQSFNPFSVKYLRTHSDYACGQLTTWRGNKTERTAIMDVMGKLYVAMISKPVFVAYDVRDVGDPFIAEWRKKHSDVKFITWTVRNDAELELAKKTCDNYIFEGFVPAE